MPAASTDAIFPVSQRESAAAPSSAIGVIQNARTIAENNNPGAPCAFHCIQRVSVGTRICTDKEAAARKINGICTNICVSMNRMSSVLRGGKDEYAAGDVTPPATPAFLTY